MRIPLEHLTTKEQLAEQRIGLIVSLLLAAILVGTCLVIVSAG